jgi:hypothetical protein
MYQNVLLSTLNTNAMARTVSMTGEMLIRSRRMDDRNKGGLTEGIAELSQDYWRAHDQRKLTRSLRVDYFLFGRRVSDHRQGSRTEIGFLMRA